MKLADIWKIQDVNEMLEELYAYVDDKCAYGEDLGALSASERVFYVTYTLEMEINNGGFVQFFINCPDIADEVEAAFVAIGMPLMAKICKKAREAFDEFFPGGADDVNEDALDALYTGQTGEFLDELENVLLVYEDELAELNSAYVLAHRADFE